MMPAQYQDLVLPSLRRLVKHQRQHDPSQRYESRFLYSVADQLRWQGIDLPARPGPWTVGARWLQGPGRGGLPVIPLVQRANTVVMTDTWDEARRLAGLLNWCHAPSLAHSYVPGVSRREPAVEVSTKDENLNSRWHANLATPANLAGAVQMNGSASMAPGTKSGNTKDRRDTAAEAW